MDVGIGGFLTDLSPAPAELARAAEAAGFTSLLVPEHTNIPVDHTPHPSGKPLPEPYKRLHDPIVALATAAAATTTLRLGFGVMLVAQRDPIVTAKALASLDRLSGGRVVLGIGAGWNVPEGTNSGVPWDRRFGRMREHVEAMRAIWTQDEASYHGEHVDFDPLWSWPKPVQDPLPVLVGGHGKRVLDRIVRYADGWMPMVAGDALPGRIAELHERAAAAGRPRPRVVFFGAHRRDPDGLARLREAGVDEAILQLPTADAAGTMAALDEATATRDAAAA